MEFSFGRNKGTSKMGMRDNVRLGTLRQRRISTNDSASKTVFRCGSGRHPL